MLQSPYMGYTSLLILFLRSFFEHNICMITKVVLSFGNLESIFLFSNEYYLVKKYNYADTGASSMHGRKYGKRY